MAYSDAQIGKEKSSLNLENFAYSIEWLNLLYYLPQGAGRYKSEVDQSTFFISEKGKTDPYQELIETLRIFQSQGKTFSERHQQKYLCAFPARKILLEQKLKLQFENVDCPVFDEWRSGFQAHSVSVVYSSVYAGNPASMFGHTLLRLNRQSLEEREGENVTSEMDNTKKFTNSSSTTLKSDQFSYGANFAAAVPVGENSVKYAIWGVFGGYEGRFSFAPYYLKINEYNHAESRDLWEYDLSLNEKEMEMLLKHFWELYAYGGRDYYFIDENCSYVLLRVLAAIRPDLDLKSSSLYLMPSESIKILKKNPSLVRRKYFRPSLRKRLLQSYEQLTPQEQERFDQFIELVSDTSVEHNAANMSLNQLSVQTLDALILNQEYQKFQKKEDWTIADQSKFKLLLIERSKRKIIQDEAKIVTINEKLMSIQKDVQYLESSSPENSHPPSRWSFGIKQDYDQKKKVHFKFKTLSHDALDIRSVYEAYSQLELFSIDLNYELLNQKLSIHQLNLIEMTSIYDLRQLHPKTSYHVQWQWRDHLRQGKTLGFNGGVGYGLHLLNHDQMFYHFFEAELNQSFAHERYRFSGLQFVISSRIGLYVQLFDTEMWKHNLEFKIRKNFDKNISFSDFQIKWEQSFNLDLQNQVRIKVENDSNANRSELLSENRMIEIQYSHAF